MSSSARIQRIALTVSVLMLAACNTANTHIGDEDPAFGEALKYDQAIQILNPAPVYTANGAQPGDNGERAAKAVETYRKGEVKDVETISTSSGSGGGSGGGSGPQ